MEYFKRLGFANQSQFKDAAGHELAVVPAPEALEPPQSRGPLLVPEFVGDPLQAVDVRVEMTEYDAVRDQERGVRACHSTGSGSRLP